MRILIVIILMLLTGLLAHGQTHNMPGSNVVPSGASLTINSGASITAAAGSTVTGFGSGGGGSGTVTSITATTPIVVTPSPLVATGVISLTVGSTGGVQAWDADLDTWATKTPYAGTLTITTGKTFNVTNSLTLSGTDSSTLNIGGGGTLGTAAYTATGAYEVPLTFSTGLTRSTNTVTVNTSQNITKLSNLTSNGFVKTGSSDGTLSVDTATYQAADTDLTTWAGITPVAAVGTWIATPSSANLRLAMTDENGTGAALFNGATTPDFTTGFTIGAAAASGKIPIGNGTNYVPSTPTYPNAASTALKHIRSDGTNFITSTATISDTPSTALKWLRSDGTNWITSTSTLSDTPGTANKILKSDGTNWATSTETYAVPGTSGNVLTSDGTNWTSAAPVVTASNTLTFTNKRITPRVTSTATATTWAPSADTDDVYEITGQTAPVTTISNPAGTPVDGQSLIIRFSDNGTARALSWTGSQWQAGPGLALPTTTIVGNHDYVGFKWNSTTSKWTMVASTQLTGQTDDTAYGSSWNAVTGLSPSKNAIYDELHLIDTADNGSIVNATTGFRIGGAAASGKILQADGTNFIASTATWPTTNTAGYTVRGDGTNYAVYPQDMLNSSVSSQSPSTSDVYVAGSNVVVAAGDFKVKGQYRCLFDVTKSAGTGGIVISVRSGTLGTTGDTAQLTFTFPAGTSVADVGTFEVFVNWRTIGSGTSAVIEGVCRAQKNTVTAAGLWGDTSAAKVIVATVSSGFASTTFTNMGVSFNGGTAFAGTVTTVQASLLQ